MPERRIPGHPLDPGETIVLVEAADDAGLIVRRFGDGPLRWMAMRVAPASDDMDGVPLPSLALLTTDGSDSLLEPVDGTIVGPARVEVHNGKLRRGPLTSPVPIDRVGPPDIVKLAITLGDAYLITYEGADHLVIQLPDGMSITTIESDLAEEQRQVEREREVRQQQAARTRATAHAGSNDHFVNPYNFVPTPSEPAERHAPGWHDGLAAERYSGTISVDWTALSPLLLRNAQTGAAGSPMPRNAAGSLVVPGSSLKGAIRSLHETLTGSCFRLVDLEFIPAYRDFASVSHRAGWVLGLIETVDHNGRPTRVRLTKTPEWIESQQLGAGPDVTSGDRFTIRGTSELNRFFRRQQFTADATATADPNGTHVVMVTDAAARAATKGYHHATGELTDTMATVSDAAWSTYLHAVAGADGSKEDEGRRVPEEVAHAGTVVGNALTPGRRMDIGQVIWVKASGNRIDAIALSALWRTTGSGPVSERLDHGFHPCTDPNDLCPSCRIFGSADTGGAQEGAPQRSYRGHIRFGEAIAGHEAATVRFTLPPLGQPRPGAGQFYLRNDPNRRKTAAADTHVPLRQWGSTDDSPLRPVAGRKFYWSAAPVDIPDQQGRRSHRRDRARPDQQNLQMVNDVEALAPGTVLTSMLRFENLTMAEVGSLLAAISPQLVCDGLPPGAHLGEGQITARLGGGKPLGLGIVRSEITNLALHTAADRYLGTPSGAAPSVEECVAAFVEQVPEPVRQTWADLAAMLHTGHVAADRVWYPPGSSWDQVGTKAFDETYKFFQRTTGAYTTSLDKPMVPLRPPHDLDQYLPIRPEPEDAAT